MVKLKIILLLLGAIAASSALQLRSEEHIRRRDEMLGSTNDFTEQFRVQYDNYTKYGVMSGELKSMFSLIKLPEIFGKRELEELPPDAAIISCLFCRTTFALLLQRFRSGSHTRDEIKDQAVDFCMQATPYGFTVCRGLIDLNADIVFHIVEARPTLTANQMCSVALQGECGEPDPVFDFTVTVSAGPPITQHKSGSTPRNPNELRILHFSDTHYDPVRDLKKVL